jgi:hypothetical protein
MVVGIPCMANTNPKINNVHMNVITTLAGCCGEPLAQAQAGPALPVDHRGRIAAAHARVDPSRWLGQRISSEVATSCRCSLEEP